MSCPSCGFNPCQCGTCAGANTIYQCPCPDPGLLTSARHLSGLDAQFCPGRLENNVGFLVSQQQASGAYSIGFTTEPTVPLANFQATQSVAFGNLVMIAADGSWRQLLGPATANLYPRTNAAGEIIFDVLPPSTVPDPLAVTTLNATTANIGTLNVSGTSTLTGVLAGTIVNFLGLNASNQIVSTTTAGISAAMFYEAASSPAASYPNSGVAGGGMLTIGNMLFDSGQNIISVTNATTLTVAVAGKYLIWWCGFQVRPAGADRAGLWLQINSIVVNQGTGVPGGVAPNVNTNQISMTGMEARSLSVGDTIQLQSNPAAGLGAWLVRLVAVRISS